jgi:hypothetical protein
MALTFYCDSALGKRKSWVRGALAFKGVRITAEESLVAENT